MDAEELEKIKEVVAELLQKMTVVAFKVEVSSLSHNDAEINPPSPEALEGQGVEKSENEVGKKDSVDINITVEDPQVLIGQNGQTLFEMQRLLRMILNKKLSQLQGDQGSGIESEKKGFYITLDINDYKKQKIEYLKKMATASADDVVLTKEKKVLPPMPAYERRIIHAQLSKRQDIITESQGEGIYRCVVISPR